MKVTGVSVVAVVVTSVISAVAVRVLQLYSSGEVLLLTGGGPVVRTKAVLCSPAWNTSVASRF